MKTKEEKLKIWSSYLPYNLETAYCDRFGDILKVGVLNNIQYNESETHPLRLSIEGLYELEHEWKFKPFLWDMDMLTKEIEHKGERFVPIEKLFDIETGLNWSSSDYIKTEKGKNEYWTRSKDSGKSFYFGFNSERNYFYHIDSSGFQQSVKNQLEMFQKLFEWHFNVFGLDESEYIKKQSVIQK